MKENCWKFPKFHELLHAVDDIERFGAPRNFNAERPESLLIYVLIYAAKQPGRRAQKRHAGCVYELQSAQQLADSLIIADMVHFHIWGDNVAHDDLSASNDADDTIDTESVILQTSDQATFVTVTCRFGGTRATSRQYKVERYSCSDLNFLRLPTALL